MKVLLLTARNHLSYSTCICFSNTWKLERIKHSKYINSDRRNTTFQKVRKESLPYKNEQFKTTLPELTYKFSAILIIIPAKFLIDICYGQSVDVLSKFICWSLNPQSDYLEIWAFVQVIKVKWGYKSWALIQQNWCPYKQR